MPKYSLHQSLLRARNDRKKASEGSVSCTPLLESPRKTNNTKFPSLPTPPLSPSPSQPSIVFPTKTTPSPSPTSFKKRALSIPMGCRCHALADEELPYEPESLNTGRCPTLRMLKNMRRTGSPTPRPTSPTLRPTSPTPRPTSSDTTRPESLRPVPSSHSSSLVEISRPPSSVEMGRSAMSDPSPPLLTLPSEGTMDMGLGWADEFGMMIDTRVPPPRPWSTTFTQASDQTSWSQASRVPSNRSIREYPTLSTGFFSTGGLSSTMPSPTAVLNAAESRRVALPPPVDDPFLFQESVTTHEEVPSVHFQEYRDASSLPPRLGFQLRRSSEDWATAVLRAVGTYVD